MGRQLDRMKKAIAENRKKAGERAAMPKHCCQTGWADVHTAACLKRRKEARRAK